MQRSIVSAIFSLLIMNFSLKVSGICDCSKIRIDTGFNLQVLYENEWLPVCSSVVYTTATVACRMLGYSYDAWWWYGNSVLVKDGLYIECSGDEDNVFDCPTVSRQTCSKIIFEEFGCYERPDCKSCREELDIRIVSELQFLQLGEPDEKLDVIPQLLFICNVTVDDEYKYQIEWVINGEYKLTLGPGNDIRSMGLHEHKLLEILGDSPVHGTQLQCGIMNVTNSTEGNSTMSYSNALVIGAQLKDPVIYLSKTASSYIDIQFNVPVGCGYTVHQNEQPAFPCLYSLQLNSKDPWSYSKGSVANIVTNPVGNKFCTEPLKLLEKPEDWNHTDYFHRLEISTTDETYEDGEEYTLELKFDYSISHRLWKNYVFPEVKVIVTDTKSNLNKICYSQVDPHMRSADSTYYEHQKIGTFVFYRNMINKIEVQEKLKGCGGFFSRARCACAVAVSAGADVFMINLCGSINFFGFTQCNDGGLLDVKMLDQQRYQVITPTGSRIEIQVNTFIPRTLNTVMYMSPKDKYNTEGECGEFDDDRSNDFKHRDGTFTSNSGSYGHSPDAFSESWEVSEEDDLFANPDIELESWENNNQYYCQCKRQGKDSSDTVCSKKQNYGYQEELSITRKKCKLSSRKRSLGQHDDEMRRLFDLMTTDRAERVKREAEANITEEEAKIVCSAINASLVATNFTDISGGEDIQAVISQCEMDVVEMNDPSMVQMHIDALNNIAKNILDLTPSYTANNTDDVLYFLANSCPSNCSGQGQCTEYGACSCEEGYGGADCSISLSDPLTIDDIEGGGLCDTAYGDECLCFTVRTDSLLEGFTCSVGVLEIPREDMEQFSRNVVVTGDYEDVFTGVCCLPDEKSFTSAFASKLRFAISNDAVNYGTPVDVVVFDSTCQTINVTDNYTVSLKENFCFIDGNCVEHLKSRTAANCSICDTRNSTDQWISFCTDVSEDENARTLILALSICSAVVGLVIVAGLSRFVWMRCKTQKIIPKKTGGSTMASGYDKVYRTAFDSNIRSDDIFCIQDKSTVHRGLSLIEVEFDK